MIFATSPGLCIQKVGNSFLSHHRLIGLNRTLAQKAQRLSVHLTLHLRHNHSVGLRTARVLQLLPLQVIHGQFLSRSRTPDCAVTPNVRSSHSSYSRTSRFRLCGSGSLLLRTWYAIRLHITFSPSNVAYTGLQPFTIGEPHYTDCSVCSVFRIYMPMCQGHNGDCSLPSASNGPCQDATRFSCLRTACQTDRFFVRQFLSILLPRQDDAVRI